MSEVTDKLKPYADESNQMLQDFFSKSQASQDKTIRMQTEQAEKLALRDELRTTNSDAIKDKFSQMGDWLMNWTQVTYKEQENKVKAQLGMPVEKDLVAEQAQSSLNAANDSFSGIDNQAVADDLDQAINDSKSVDAKQYTDNATKQAAQDDSSGTPGQDDNQKGGA